MANIDGETYHGENPIYPSIANVICDKPENERRKRNTKRNHERPYPHISCSIFLKERLHNHSTSNGRCRGDEEGGKGSTSSHGSI